MDLNNHSELSPSRSPTDRGAGSPDSKGLAHRGGVLAAIATGDGPINTYTRRRYS
jgi:hypothetical protein